MTQSTDQLIMPPMPWRSVFLGSGAMTPSRIVTNVELETMMDTSDAWIQERTGIAQRAIAGPLETTASLGAEAARRALANASVSPDAIDLIICATATPDRTFPATAALIQADLGIPVAIAFDVQAVCSGFVYAMSVADAMLASGQAKTALVIGAETFSRILDWSDRTTAVLFGDGAGAMVLGAVASAQAGSRGVLAHALRADGRQADLLYVDGGPSQGGRIGKLKMQGQAVFRHAVGNISEAISACCEKAGVKVSDIDWFVPHQANRRILDGVARRMGLDDHKVVTTVHQHGNTSAASVPLAFEVARQDGRICDGDLVLLEAMGGGFTWGASLIRL
ncbi:3-oxoacyl-[acyl-carrier-protein] synthase 3 [Candidatus Phycosocius bacilliformis]|uniref:Beta-ketoacyl-[acyl-carrier-protein] synthase III n=2 Tax=Candidatus Phycosocius bacilliformis TaxID=1445552 RepID=A0A2P2E8H1_9PROT|nr:3-oxoacyl-[acyl-carrier-protein] synthase 3 [Candidatus Phycosocius bacilliformis]